MTELALLLESSTWENITGTHYYKKAVDRAEWASSQLSEEVQVPFKKKYGKWSFRRVLLKRSMSNQASDTQLFSNSCCAKRSPTALVSRTQVFSRWMKAGWNKCNILGDTALENTPNLTCGACRQAPPDFQWLLQQREVYKTLLSLAALFQTTGTALKLPSCSFHTTDIIWKRLKTEAASLRSNSYKKKRKQFKRA